MQRLVKWIVRAGVISTVLLAILLLWALQGLDETPYFKQPLYETMRARLDSTLAHYRPVRGRLEAGFGVASLTPRLGALNDDIHHGHLRAVPLAGYSGRDGRPAHGVHDSLFVKAVALRAGDQLQVLVSLDALIVPQEVAEAAIVLLAAEPGLRREQVLFAATHTHSGPGGWGEGAVAEQFAGPFNPVIRRWLVQQVVAAIRAAHGDLRPAALAVASFDAPEQVENRLVGEKGWCDSEFHLIALQQQHGRRALLGVYAAHATTCTWRTMQLSADYPGYWQRALEQDGTDLALFFAGAVGSHGPRGDGEEYTRAQRIGEALADSVRAHLPALQFSDSLTIASLGLPVELPEHQVRITDRIRLRPLLGRMLLPMESTYLQVFRLGTLLWVSTPCDFSGELALDLKAYARQRDHDLIVSSFNGSYIGYVLPGKYYHLPGYETRVMAWFGPYMGAYFDELIRRMLLGVISAKTIPEQRTDGW